jgi:hypothetical protein
MLHYRVIKSTLNLQDELETNCVVKIDIGNDPLAARGTAFSVCRLWMDLVGVTPQPIDCEIWIVEEQEPGDTTSAGCVFGRDYDLIVLGLTLETQLLRNQFPVLNLPIKPLHHVIENVFTMLMFGERLEHRDISTFPDVIESQSDLTINRIQHRINHFDRIRRRYLGLPENPLRDLPF